MVSGKPGVKLLAPYLLKLKQVQTTSTVCHTTTCCLQMFLGVSASQAFLLNLCIFRCTTINSPLATTITGTLDNLAVGACTEPVMVADLSRHAGQMKDIVTTGLGMVLFGDVQFSSKNLFGISVGLLGGMLYSFFGYMERQTQKRQQNKV